VARIDLSPDEPAGGGVPADVAEELAERVVALVLDRLAAAPTTQIPVQVVVQPPVPGPRRPAQRGVIE
jgi:hypothetical protein